jgi:hydrogenase-4 component E
MYFFAALLVVLNFGMLVQRRMLGLIRLLILQGLVLALNLVFIAYATQQKELYLSVLLTLILKVWLIPYILLRLLIRFNIHGKIELLVNIPTTLLVGFALVIFAFDVSFSIPSFTTAAYPHVLALALASVFLSSLMMIVKRKAVSQVIGLLALENSLFFAANSTPYGMPLVVELGIAFDVLVGLFIFGIFFFQIRENFDSFDLKHLENLKEE